MTRALILSILLAACGGGHKAVVATPEPKPDPIPKTAGPDCKSVAEHVVTVMFADEPDAQAPMGTLISGHCSTDKWSDEARSCLATIQNESEGEGCAKMLTEAQHKAVIDDVKAHNKGGMDAATPTSSSAPPAPAPPGRATRGATKKEPPKDAKGGPAKSTGDPCQGGE